jgi:rhodanese-related sulfurtransferase
MNVARRRATGRLPQVAAGMLLALFFAAPVRCSAAGSGTPAAVVRGDPWKAAQLIRPAELARVLADSTAPKPLLLHVGFKPLYRAGAIPGSRYVGAGSRPEGLAALRRAVKGVPKDRNIVLYCGCCPWDHCPNMRPAFRTMRGLGYTNVRAMLITKNLDDDWVAKGYPIEKPK